MSGHNDRHANGRGTGSVRDLVAGKLLPMGERGERVTTARPRKTFALSRGINAAKFGTTERISDLFGCSFSPGPNGFCLENVEPGGTGHFTAGHVKCPNVGRRAFR